MHLVVSGLTYYSSLRSRCHSFSALEAGVIGNYSFLFLHHIIIGLVGFFFSCWMHYLFAEIQPGQMLCVYTCLPAERHQVVRSTQPQESEGDPDQNCLLHTYWKVWVFSIQV